jgi:hypothetical protein
MKIVSEFLNTLSGKPSFFSSKRIERFAVFTTMLLATVSWMGMHIVKCSLSATDLVLVVGTWLAYGGFNTLQIKKDKKEVTNENTNI